MTAKIQPNHRSKVIAGMTPNASESCFDPLSPEHQVDATFLAILFCSG